MNMEEEIIDDPVASLPKRQHSSRRLYATVAMGILLLVIIVAITTGVLVSKKNKNNESSSSSLATPGTTIDDQQPTNPPPTPVSKPAAAPTSPPVPSPTPPPVSEPTKAPVLPPPTAPPIKTVDGESWKTVSEVRSTCTRDRFGTSLSMSSNGKFIAVGAHHQEGNGYVMVYELKNNDGDDMVPTGGYIESLNTNAASDDEFGWAVALSGDGIILAVGDQTESVVVYQYYPATQSWPQMGDTISGGLGYSVALSLNGRRLAIGGKGTVRIYAFQGSKWVQQGSDIESVSGDGRKDSMAVAISSDGGVVAVGDPSHDNVGYAAVYRFDDTSSTWSQLGESIFGKQLSSNDNFGNTIALSASGMRLAIGGDGVQAEAKNSGYVQVYDYTTANGWTQAGDDIIGLVAGDQFGDSVALSDDGNTLAVGAKQAGRDGTSNGQGEAGYARVFSFVNSVEWHQLGETIQGADNKNRHFGSSIDISADGTAVVVGDPISYDPNYSFVGFIGLYQAEM